MELTPRPYQIECLEALAAQRAAGDAGAAQQLVVLPTGSGKTIVAAIDMRRVVEATGRGAIFLAHRDELIRQPEEKIPYAWPDVEIGVVQGMSGRFEFGKPVTLASVQTVSRWSRLEQLVEAQCYSILYVDEAHHAPADTYRRVMDVLRHFNPELIVVGLTATPVRADATAMATAGFTSIAYSKSILDLMRDGYLADIRMLRVDMDVDLDGVHTQAGDLNNSELRDLLAQPPVMAEMVDAWKANCGERTLCFAVDVEHAERLAATFRARGVSAEMVCGETPVDERRDRIERFQRGGFDVLANVGIASEGYDDPTLPAIMLARPTKSQTLYIQMAGRGTRLAPGKERMTLLDFAYNTSRHSIVQLPHLFGFDDLEPRRLGRRTFLDEEPAEHLWDIPSILALVREATEVDATRPPPRAGLHWVKTRYGHGLDIGRDQGFLTIRSAPEQPTRFQVWHHRPRPGHRLHDAILLTREPMLYEWAFGLAEDAVRNMLSSRKADRFVGRDATWRDAPASDKQVELIEKLGLVSTQGDLYAGARAASLTKGEAAEILTRWSIERELEPATRKQLRFIERLGGLAHPDLTKREAMELITSLKGEA